MLSSTPKPSTKKAGPSVSPNSETVENRRVSFVDLSESVSVDASMPPSQLSLQNAPISEEEYDFSLPPSRHPSLIAKFGSLNVFKASSGKLAVRWCNLSAVKFRIFARNNHSDLKQSVECSDIERVDDVMDSQDIVMHPIVLTFRKSRLRQRPIILSASSHEVQQDWITVRSHRDTCPAHITPTVQANATVNLRCRLSKKQWHIITTCASSRRRWECWRELGTSKFEHNMLLKPLTILTRQFLLIP
jgi:hypothetical protein